MSEDLRENYSVNNNQVTLHWGKAKRGYQIISEPLPHILVESRKELHGWWPGKRECTGERLLINPYNGCTFNCFFCYARGFRGYFSLYREKGIVTVFQDFDREVAKQLDSLYVASPGYLSPVTDPFQPLNNRYRLSEKIIREFVTRNIPIEFITKGVVREEVVDLIKMQTHSFGQVTILTLDDELRKILVPGGASTAELLGNFRRLSRQGIFTVARLDPIFPYLTDSRPRLKDIISRLIDKGVNHIVASCLDIPHSLAPDILSYLKYYFGSGLVYDYRRLYRENIDGYLHADINYRKQLFDLLRSTCDKKRITFALCMEYELLGKEVQGLNREFMSSTNCEGIDIPVYIRKGGIFQPAADCYGACLFCMKPECGIADLAMGKKGSKKDWKLADYRRWGREIQQTKFFK